MKSLLQRVSKASVTVDGVITGEIGTGILVLLGFEKADTETQIDFHIKKLLNLRIFSDDMGRMNRSVTEVGGGLLIVSQFTLAATVDKGSRPGFDNAMAPEKAKRFYDLYLSRLRDETTLQVETGEFGAMMDVALVNDGPVTFWLDR